MLLLFGLARSSHEVVRRDAPEKAQTQALREQPIIMRIQHSRYASSAMVPNLRKPLEEVTHGMLKRRPNLFLMCTLGWRSAEASACGFVYSFWIRFEVSTG